LFDLRTEMRLRFGCQGLDRSVGDSDRGESGKAGERVRKRDGGGTDDRRLGGAVGAKVGVCVPWDERGLADIVANGEGLVLGVSTY